MVYDDESSGSRFRSVLPQTQLWQCGYVTSFPAMSSAVRQTVAHVERASNCCSFNLAAGVLWTRFPDNQRPASRAGCVVCACDWQPLFAHFRLRG